MKDFKVCLWTILLLNGMALELGYGQVQQHVLSGQVLEGFTEGPLYGANVRLLSRSTLITVSDLEGRFEFNPKVKTGSEDTLVVSYIGFETKKQTVAEFLASDRKIRLEPASNIFETVEVKAEQLIAKEFSTRRIDKLDIYTNPSAKADPLLAVQSLPAETSTEETANISLRGSSPSETTILLNNVPIKDAVKLDQANGVGQFSIFNTAMIESVNVFTSNPPLEFGASSSGAIALYTDVKSGARVNNLSLSFAGIGAYVSRGISKTTDLTLFGNWSRDRLLKSLNRTSLENIQQFSTTDGGIYLSSRSRKGHQIKFFNYSLFENYQYAFTGPNFDGVFDQKKNKNQSILNLIFPLKKGKIELNQGFNVSRGRYAAGNLDNAIYNRDYYADINYAYAGNKWSLKTGISYQDNSYTLEAQFPLYRHAFGDGFPTVEVADTDVLRIPEWFVYSKYYLSPKWTIGTGVRYHPGFFDRKAYWSRQLNLSYQPADGHQLIIATGKYHKYVQPGVDFTTTTLISSEHLALDYQYQGAFLAISTALYYKKGNWNQVENDIVGAEIFAGISTARLNAGLSFATVNSILKSKDGTSPSPYDIGYYGRLLVKYDIPSWFEINAVMRWRQGRYYLPFQSAVYDGRSQTFLPTYSDISQGSRLPDYRGFDLGLSKIIPMSFGALVAFANANNVFDFKNVRGYTYNFDYSDRLTDYYNRRVFFAGVMLSW